MSIQERENRIKINEKQREQEKWNKINLENQENRQILRNKIDELGLPELFLDIKNGLWKIGEISRDESTSTEKEVHSKQETTINTAYIKLSLPKFTYHRGGDYHDVDDDSVSHVPSTIHSYEIELSVTLEQKNPEKNIKVTCRPTHYYCTNGIYEKPIDEINPEDIEKEIITQAKYCNNEHRESKNEKLKESFEIEKVKIYQAVKLGEFFINELPNGLFSDNEINQLKIEQEEEEKNNKKMQVERQQQKIKESIRHPRSKRSFLNKLFK